MKMTDINDFETYLYLNYFYWEHLKKMCKKSLMVLYNVIQEITVK